MFYKVKGLVMKLWHSDLVMRVVHTFWAAALSALVTGLVAAHSSADIKAVLFTAITTGVTAVRVSLVARKG